MNAPMGFVSQITNHLDALFEASARRPLADGMWMSAIDPQTGGFPSQPDNPSPISYAWMQEGCALLPGKRAYRNIDAPNGCSLYWDQPLAAAAVNIGGSYKQAAMDYMRAYINKCTTDNGMLLWGNHYYFDMLLGKPVRFDGNETPAPVDLLTETGDMHELRPFTPAWDLFFCIDHDWTERYIRVMLEKHLFDPATGGFNRHANKKKGCAFLEAGGVLIDTLAILYARTKRDTVRDALLKMARYSFAYRDEHTGLIENNPTVDRWDKFISTTECGLWAGALLRAASLTDMPELGDMAAAVLSAYLHYGWDTQTGKLFGRLNVKDGSPDKGLKSTLFQPLEYASAVDPIYPNHDTPYSFMEACLDVYQSTKNALYRTAVERWIGIINDELLDEGSTVYAEHYGRAILLCLRAEDYGIPGRKLAEHIAQRALTRLCHGRLLIGHDGSRYYSAVDGIGYLFLGLMYLETGTRPNLFGLSV
ncbi:hypothetical protein AGMMS49992_15750 [Clostridia bacterium]|nr:hypothetical protein AGMMS49992_15750 [Clostridia bacterium]